MKKVKFITLMCCLAILLTNICVPCFANTHNGNSMVYASKELSDKLYELLQKDSFDYKKVFDSYKLTVVKETITPIYYVDMLPYAQTGEFNIKPVWLSPNNAPNKGKGNCYIAKLLTYDNQYAGAIEFYIENGIAYSARYFPSENSGDWPNNEYYLASPSYADHDERIAEILGEDEIIPAKDVKYVSIDWIGSFFYIKNDKHDVLVSVGYISADKSDTFFGKSDYLVDHYTELLDIAEDQLNKYEKYLKYKAEFEEKHPGEIMLGYNNMSPIISGCSEVDNILDIAEYLNIDYSLFTDSDFGLGYVSNDIDKAENEDDSVSTYIIIGTSVLLIAFAVTAILYKKKRV